MPSARSYVLNVILALVPDILVGWAAARLSDSGWSGFFWTLLALQVVYFFFWFKTVSWAWLLFWLIGKRQMAAQLENSFIESRFPPPDEFTLDLDDYLSGITGNEEVGCDTRVRAAFEHGTINGLKIARRYTLVMQLDSAAKMAFKRYARLAARFHP